jgi:arginase
MPPKQDIQLVGVPIDLGAGRRGVDMGPSALRIAGIGKALSALGHRVQDAGNLAVPQRETVPEGDEDMRFLAPIASVCRDLYAVVRQSLLGGRTPIVLGGDHSLAMGSIAGAADAARHAEGRLGVIWLDAHGDMNTGETSPTGNIHGMPLACLLGSGAPELTGIAGRHPAIDAVDVALIGIRAIDPEERRAIRDAGIHAFTMREVDSVGMQAVVDEAIAALAHCDRLHVSFDVDFLDPGIAPGVGTRVRGGPDYREAHLVMEMLSDTRLVRSVDIVELNPILDRENATAELAVELIASLFGKQIL